MSNVAIIKRKLRENGIPIKTYHNLEVSSSVLKDGVDVMENDGDITVILNGHVNRNIVERLVSQLGIENVIIY